ncbi:hypothetical protein T440DRAFT_124983 [Plenodomus tracheiphilus IPT5]|uniref:Restriction endonuclease type IV Mrr domain-containing protein n=1 Tax=Plenodomus tracheiphilus IPT5 TaxID=1408161 RepID=A0A6A7B2X6_9PLEO|nr:hypothetical protein T440DRAFT_124983 [Plenodomus tracheiphilus IPT5]
MRPPLRPPCLRKTWLLLGHPLPAPRVYVPRRIATTSASNPAPVDLPKLIISPGSAHHNSLPTFLDYAKRVNLTSEKTTYIGTHYEYITAIALMRLGFSLLRIGRTHDAGIDLIGHWVLAPLQEPLPVIVQCKARKIPLNPMNIRELEGSFQGTPADWKKKDVLGLLVTTLKASRGTLKALGQSRLPMGFVLVSREGLVEQFVWNRAAAERGLEGVGVTVRHTPRALLNLVDVVENTKNSEAPKEKTKKRDEKFKNTGTHKDIQLTWMGSPIFPDRQVLDPETVNLMRYIVPSDDAASDPSENRDLRVVSKGGRWKYRPMALAPKPRGGVVGGKRGRPFKKGKSESSEESEMPPRPQGRPRKVTDETAAGVEEMMVKTKRKPGRPKGSKNKPKPVSDAG